jgi:hypothetical protein
MLFGQSTVAVARLSCDWPGAPSILSRKCCKPNAYRRLSKVVTAGAAHVTQACDSQSPVKTVSLTEALN